MTIIEEAYKGAINVIAHCARATGFYASGLPGGYEATWARDSMVTSLGATLVDDSKFQIAFRKSLELLSANQSELGQIPNAVGSYNTDRRSDVTFNSIDSSLWYLIGQYVYANSYGDEKLLRRFKKNIDRVFLWLQYQDPNEDKLLAQQPTMDWQDAFPHKYGHVINTQALYYGTLKLYDKDEEAKHLKRVVNGEIEKYLAMYESRRGYYVPWNWKNHDGDREQEEWFDTLGNLLAIVMGLATPKITNSILDYIEKTGIDRPYACKAIYPPINPGDKEWHSYFSKCDARKPYAYLNGGIWPFIGGFYVTALIKAKRYEKASLELELLAKANKSGLRMEWEFNEWLDGKSGKPKGEPYQGWSAGTYLLAYESVKRGSVPFFS